MGVFAVGEMFSGDPDVVGRWLAVAGLLAALGSAAIVWMVFRRPATWRGTPAAHWAMLLGCVVLPGIAMLTANVNGLAYSSSRSCMDCHSMDPWVADLQNPVSTTLASRHYQRRWINHDACYTCHSGYGLAGGVKAKIGGMQHVWYQYVAGVPATIEMSAPFDHTACLGCHAETARFRASSTHADPDLREPILTGQYSCTATECHGPPHPRPGK